MLLTPKLAKFSAGLGIVLSILAGCSSSDPTNVAADFSAQGIKGKIEGEIVVIDLSDLGNCATTIENMTIAAETFGASVSPDPRVARDYTNPVEFTVTAPDGTKAVFKVKVKGADCISKPVVSNTPLVLGSLTCTPVEAFPLNIALPEATMNCEITATDPDGIASYEFKFEDTSRVATEYPNTLTNPQQNGNTFSVQIVCSEDFDDSTFYLTFFVTGKKLDGSSEGVQSSEIELNYSQICPANGT
jgi:hypothetical protein